jgi:hypothetical protein
MNINYNFKTLDSNYSLIPNNKDQIVLGHTSRNIKTYLDSVKLRKSIKIPNYTIDKTGCVYNHFTPDNYSFVVPNEKTITIFLENDGWLIKKRRYYYNWIGDIYKGDVHEQEWRGHKYWATYTDEQIKTLKGLIDELCNKYTISRNTVNHNTKLLDPTIVKGVLCRSNYYEEYTDLSPAFDFSTIKNKIKKK